MRNEIYTQVVASVNAVAEHINTGLSVKAAVAREGGRLVQHSQGKLNRGLLAEGIALASTEADDPEQVLTDTWKQMEANIHDANKARVVVASFYRLVMEAQHEASVITLPIGEAQTWTSFNTFEELERALEFEPKLVEQLTNQGLSRLSVADLRLAAEQLTEGQIKRYLDFLVTMGKYMKNEQWTVRIGKKGTRINSIALKQFEAVKRVRNGGEAPASDLANGLASMVVWMVDTALTHQRIVDTIPVRDPRYGTLSPFWVEGRVDVYNPDEPDAGYYAGEEPVKVRFAHFEQVESVGDNTEQTIENMALEAQASWAEVANEWMITVDAIHDIAAESRKPLQYRLRSGLTITELARVKEESLAGIMEREGKKQEEFEAKRAGIKLSTQRDAVEGWEAATKGILNASQLAQLNKMRAQAGLVAHIDDTLKSIRDAGGAA